MNTNTASSARGPCLLPLVLIAAITSSALARAQSSPPFPTIGQTVHWTLAMSPISLNTDRTVLPQGTIVVDPGVEVRLVNGAVLSTYGRIEFEPGSTFHSDAPAMCSVYGSASFRGVAGSPVLLRGGSPYLTQGVLVNAGGSVDLDFVDSDLRVLGGERAFVSVEDSTFRVSGQQPLDVAGVRGERCSLVVRRAVFLGATLETQDAYLHIDLSTFDGGVLRSTRNYLGQPLWLDGLVAVNHATDAPFELVGFDTAFGPNNVIANNVFPARLSGGGIARGSTLPPTGNANDLVHAGNGSIVGRATFSYTGLPYRVDADPSSPTLGNSLTIDPGVTIRLGPQAYFWATGSTALRARGTPAAPITFTRLDPAQPWQGLTFGVNSTRPHLEWCVVEGSELGLIADDTIVRVDECVFQGNARGIRAANYGKVVARKSRFLGNAIGVQTSFGAPASGFGRGAADVDGTTNANEFVGNAIGLDVLNPSSNPLAVNNWWGASSGPSHPTNPGGAGDPVQGVAQFTPFRTAPPGFADVSPRVRILPVPFLMESGRKILLQWDAVDDGTIVEQHVLFSPHSENPDLAPLVSNLAGTTRSVEIVVPVAPPSSNIAPSVFRVLSIDDRGQQGWDEVEVFIPYVDFAGGVVPADVPTAMKPGDPIPICWTVLPLTSGTVDFRLFLDSDRQSTSLGGSHTGVTCASTSIRMPGVSTDTARLGIRYNSGAGGRNAWTFTAPFAIRPDARVGDAPPAVNVSSPAPGQLFPSPAIVPVRWTSTDDEGVRLHEVQASYDAGRTWFTIAEELAGTANAFDWSIPPTTGIDDVRVRVIAFDVRYQNTSSTVPISILGGASAGNRFCFGDGTAGVACPCGPGAAGHGCPNSAFATGARLDALGTASVANDFILLHSTNMTGTSCVFFQGTATNAAVIDDGLGCVGGTILRLGTRPVAGGVASFPEAGGPTISVRGQIPAVGGTRHYQVFYRNAAPLYCPPATSNRTNGVSVVWGP